MPTKTLSDGSSDDGGGEEGICCRGAAGSTGEADDDAWPPSDVGETIPEKRQGSWTEAWRPISRRALANVLNQ